MQLGMNVKLKVISFRRLTCSNCRKVMQDRGAVIAVEDSKHVGILSKAATSACEHCGDPKMDAIPCLFPTYQNARAHLDMLRSQFESQNEITLKVLLIGFGDVVTVVARKMMH